LFAVDFSGKRSKAKHRQSQRVSQMKGLCSFHVCFVEEKVVALQQFWFV